MDRNDILDEILKHMTADELYDKLETSDVEWLTDEIRDKVLGRAARYQDVYEALCVYHYIEWVDRKMAAQNA